VTTQRATLLITAANLLLAATVLFTALGGGHQPEQQQTQPGTYPGMPAPSITVTVEQPRDCDTLYPDGMSRRLCRGGN
jgi:hypothetical protein